MTPRSHPPHPPHPQQPPSWSADTDLIGLVFDLEAIASSNLYPQYTIGLHAWLLDQVRQTDPNLSAYLHDQESEKPFTISSLEGEILTTARQLQLVTNQTYQWRITALSSPVVQWLTSWLQHLPNTIELRNAPLKIKSVALAPPPTTYTNLLSTGIKNTVALSFVTPTSFRRKGHHFPLPLPVNVFHSYLRRWNNFSGKQVNQDAFLEWIDESVIIHRHQLESVKVAAGKKGSVTGFIGAIEFGLSRNASEKPDWVQLFFALAQLAPYCGTGHKTTFGLGQTRSGWNVNASTLKEMPTLEDV